MTSLTSSIIHVDTEAAWVQLLQNAQPAHTPLQSTWEPVRRALGEISFPVELNSQQVAEHLAGGNCPPIRSLILRLAVSVALPEVGPDPSLLAKHIRQARGKVERTGKRADDSTLLPARLELHVPPAGFARRDVQRLLVMFAGLIRPRSILYALRLVFDEPEDDSRDI